MRIPPALPSSKNLALCILGTMIALPVGCGRVSRDAEGSAEPTGETVVSAVRGPSWLGRIGTSLNETYMGEMGGSGPPPPSQKRSEPDLSGAAVDNQSGLAEALHETFVLTGADLYRINCQACHGINGEGRPPEIHSVLPVVHALVALPEDQAIQGFLTFLGKPGEKMPPFESMQADEVGPLLSHLERLLGNGSQKFPSGTIRESAARVGEQVVKANCHICHAAVGPSGGNMPMMQGTVPPLARFSRSYPLQTLENVVRYGATGTMGMMRGSENMPPLPYLTKEEIAAAYLYLAAYPPSP